MHFIPFIYFSGLCYYLWQKHRVFDVAVYMSLLFTITSLCCVLMVQLGYMEGSGVLADGWEAEFGFIPTCLYCALITITILPFSLFRPEKLEKVTIAHKYIIWAFTLFIFVQGMVVLYLVGGSIADLLNGDFQYLKDSHYAGDLSPADVKMLTMPMPIQALYLTSYTTFFGLPLFFYFTCVEHRKIWYTWILLLVAAAPVIRGMIQADRTEIINFGLMFFFCLCLFQKLLTRQVKIFFSLASIPVLLVGVVYILAVSASRFEDKEEGASGSMLEYAGQPFANFCYFYENHNRNLYYIERELPLTSFILFQTQYTDTKEDRTAKEGFFIGVFATHIGSWLLDLGVEGATVISFIFAFLAILVIRYYDRTEYDLEELLLIFTLAVVPIFGIFYYRYYHALIALQYLAAAILYFMSRFKVVWSNKAELQSEEETKMKDEIEKEPKADKQ